MKKCLPILAFIPLPLAAALDFAPHLTDNAVLQRCHPIPISGTATPGEMIEVTFADQSRATTADATGQWRVTFDPLPAITTPQTLAARGSSETVVANNILVGDLWLCAGQSNMFYPLAADKTHPGGVPGWQAELPRATNPAIRIHNDSRHPIAPGGWQILTPQTAATTSAIAYYFARQLQRQLRIPIGILVAARGGSSIQAWIPQTAALAHPIIQKYVTLARENRQQIQAYNLAHQKIVRWQQNPSRHALPRPPDPEPLSDDLQAARSFGQEGKLYQLLIAPLSQAPVTGVLWYQGESNSSHPEIARNYDTMLQLLIATYRDAWRDPGLPFIIFQLPLHHPGKHWHLTRDAQQAAVDATPHTYLVPTLDIGDPDDLHPPDKKPFGQRAAAVAMQKIYGRQ